jgi:hypothetical protein
MDGYRKSADAVDELDVKRGKARKEPGVLNMAIPRAIST